MHRLLYRQMLVIGIVVLSLNIRFTYGDEACEEDVLLAAYTPTSDTSFVTLEEDRFRRDGELFALRGINYYPANYPWRRFLTEMDTDTLQTELDLLQETGFNSLRIFLWNEALFWCGVVPDAAAFERLDRMIAEAAARDLLLIVTLNDLPPDDLYNNPDELQAQTDFIITRYRDEPAILAWDLRNEGDIDYDGINLFKPGTVDRDVVLSWLAATSKQVRTLDDNHLITAGWRYNEQHTIPAVDFISFHHWRGASDLRDRLNLMSYDKPILLQEFGYTTYERTLEEQAFAIRDVVRLVEEERSDVLGWMVWTAFDFPLTATCYPGGCVSADNREHHFGIWYSDYTEKPVIDILHAEFERLDGLND